jgi:hypothetical protein
MGMTYYLALRGRDAESAGERDLSFLAKATDQLDLLCDALQVTSVKDFVSRWCKASDGLHTCQLPEGVGQVLLDGFSDRSSVSIAAIPR